MQRVGLTSEKCRTTKPRNCAFKTIQVSGGRQPLFRFEPDSGTRKDLVRIVSRPPPLALTC